MVQTLIIVDDDFDTASEAVEWPTHLAFQRYLHDYPKRNEPRTRVINLCDSRQYLDKGYYCSLLAEARQHQVLPTVKALNAVRNLAAQLDHERLVDLASDCLNSDAESCETLLYFGQCSEPALAELAGKLFRKYGLPIARLKVSLANEGVSWQLQSLTLKELDAQQKHESNLLSC